VAVSRELKHSLLLPSDLIASVHSVALGVGQMVKRRFAEDPAGRFVGHPNMMRFLGHCSS